MNTTSFDSSLYPYKPRDMALYTSGGVYYSSPYGYSTALLNELYNPPVLAYQYSSQGATSPGYRNVPDVISIPSMIHPMPIRPSDSEVPTEAITSKEQLVAWVKAHPTGQNKVTGQNSIAVGEFNSSAPHLPVPPSKTAPTKTPSPTTVKGDTHSIPASPYPLREPNPRDASGWPLTTIGSTNYYGTNHYPTSGMDVHSNGWPFTNVNDPRNLMVGFNGQLGSGDTYFPDFLMMMGQMKQIGTSVQSQTVPTFTPLPYVARMPFMNNQSFGLFSGTALAPSSLSSPFGSLGQFWTLLSKLH
jgi:hypothetical protein